MKINTCLIRTTIHEAVNEACERWLADFLSMCEEIIDVYAR